MSNHRLSIKDINTGMRFLIDTGANVSVLPVTRKSYSVSDSSNFKLYAANCSEIQTYGTRNLELNLNLKKLYKWTFIVANVKQPIIGADFLRHYNLLVDLNSQKLIDKESKLLASGNMIKCAEPSVSIVDGKHPYHLLLSEFSDITKPRPYRDDDADTDNDKVLHTHALGLCPLTGTTR